MYLANMDLSSTHIHAEILHWDFRLCIRRKTVLSPCLNPNPEPTQSSSGFAARSSRLQVRARNGDVRAVRFGRDVRFGLSLGCPGLQESLSGNSPPRDRRPRTRRPDLLEEHVSQSNWVWLCSASWLVKE